MLSHWRGRWCDAGLLAALAALMLLSALGCQAPQGGKVGLAEGAKARDIDTGAQADVKTVKKIAGDAQVTYNEMDTNFIAGFALIILGLLVAAAVSDGPRSERTRAIGYFLAASLILGGGVYLFLTH